MSAENAAVLMVGTVGGLGNQLYQIAAGLSYGWRENRHCVFRRAWSSESVLAPRNAYWHTLFVDLDQLNTSEWDKLAKTANVYQDFSMGHRPIPSKAPSMLILLRGYFQHHAYIQRDLYRLVPLLFPTPIRTYARQLMLDHATADDNMSKAVDLGDWAFLHVRRGDYLKLQHTHPVLPMSYYETAAANFPPRVRFIIFCEQSDLESVRAELPPSLARRIGRFVDTQIPDYLQLLMMAHCEAGGILANSSFSCWAAYASTVWNARPTFVAPTTWFVDHKMNADVSGICLPNWFRCGSKPALSKHDEKKSWRPCGVVLCTVGGSLHARNEESMVKGLKESQVPLKRVSTEADALELATGPESKHWDVIWFPCGVPNNVAPFKSKRVLYGPHHFVFPKGALVESPTAKGDSHDNAAFMCLSDWNASVYREFGGLKTRLMLTIPFGLDTDLFRPSSSRVSSSVGSILLYHKSRPEAHFCAARDAIVRRFPKNRIVTFRYGSYKRDDYRAALADCRFGVWVGCHESQGFAVQEALSMNVPLLVWDVESMFDEHSLATGTPVYSRNDPLLAGKKLTATTTPYWDERCGVKFRRADQIDAALDELEGRESDKSLRPREFAVEQLSLKACTERLFQHLCLLVPQ
jgi:hypothetical protein